MLARKMLRTLGHAEWLRFGVRDRIIRFFHNPDTCNPELFVVPFFGAKYAGNFDTFLDWSVYYYGAYAKEELRLFDDFLRTIEQPVVLDVGANVGHHTLFAAMHSKEVFSFEPFVEVAEKLKEKISVNGLTNVTLFEFALGDKNELATYVKPSTHNTGTGSFAKSGNEGETLSLPIKVGDEVLVDQNIQDIHFIKIDTEGFEPFVLRGLKNTLARCRPLVFFEWTQGERKFIQEGCQSLFPENYSFFVFVSDTVILKFFRESTYRLSLLSLSYSWPDGNLFAVPNEHIEYLRTKYPSSNAAKKLL